VEKNGEFAVVYESDMKHYKHEKKKREKEIKKKEIRGRQMLLLTNQ